MGGRNALESANSEISNNKFERMVARAKPKPSSQDRLAARVKDLVAMTVIASGMALPRPHQRNKYGRLVPVDPSTLPPLGEGAKLENLTLLSDVARRREEIQARFDRLFDALNVLDHEFDPLNMELMSLSEDEPQSPLAEQAGVSMDEQHHLRAAVDAVHVALRAVQRSGGLIMARM